MWQYNYDYLCHASHKYIDKTWKNGRWYYTYDEKSGGVRRRESSASKTNVVFKKDLEYMGLDLKTHKKVLEGTLRKGHRDSDQKGREQLITKQKAKENIQLIRDARFGANKERQLANAKAAEEEHSYNRKIKDAQEHHEEYEEKFYKSIEKVQNALKKVRELEKSSNPRSQDLDAAKKEYAKNMRETYNYLKELSKLRSSKRNEQDENGKWLTDYDAYYNIYSRMANQGIKW